MSTESRLRRWGREHLIGASDEVIAEASRKSSEEIDKKRQLNEERRKRAEVPALPQIKDPALSEVNQNTDQSAAYGGSSRRCFEKQKHHEGGMKGEFVPRLGKYVFPCRFCGKEPMQWFEVSPDTWMPFDLEKREVHNCWRLDSKSLNIHMLMDELDRLGYQAHIPRTSTWRVAFSATNESNTILFLLRAHGIDFKIYDVVRTFETDVKGKIYTEGGQIVRNYYNKSDVIIFEWILEIASRFITNAPLDKSMFLGQGKPWALSRARMIRNVYGSDEVSASVELREIYDAVSSGDGEDAYLGDGVWIGADGSWSDRDR